MKANANIKSRNIEEVSWKKFTFFYLAIASFFLAIGTRVFSSDWVSSSDFHACIEITGSFIALSAGVACLIYFFGLKNHFFLLVGLGFFIAGGEDLIHGLFAFKRIFTDIGVNFSRYIPSTYVAGRISLAVMIIAASLVNRSMTKTKRLKREAIFYSSFAIVAAGSLTALVFHFDLPQFIYPNQLISRPVDLISAILFLIAFVFVLKRFAAERSIFTGMLLASILLNTGGQIYMSFSKQLYDVFFDLAHYAKVFSYITPILGISLQGLKEITRSNQEIIERKQSEKRREEALEKLEKQNKNFKKIFKIVPTGMLLLDEDAKVVRASRFIEKLTCQDVSEITGKKIGDSLRCINAMEDNSGCGNNSKCHECAISKALGDVFSQDISVKDLEINTVFLIDGMEKRMWFKICVEPIELNNKKHAVMTLNDITEQKMVEESLRLDTEKALSWSQGTAEDNG